MAGNHGAGDYEHALRGLRRSVNLLAEVGAAPDVLADAAELGGLNSRFQAVENALSELAGAAKDHKIREAAMARQGEITRVAGMVRMHVRAKYKTPDDSIVAWGRFWGILANELRVLAAFLDSCESPGRGTSALQAARAEHFGVRARVEGLAVQPPAGEAS
jgi:hypothetical protein